MVAPKILQAVKPSIIHQVSFYYKINFTLKINLIIDNQFPQIFQLIINYNQFSQNKGCYIEKEKISSTKKKNRKLFYHFYFSVKMKSVLCDKTSRGLYN